MDIKSIDKTYIANTYARADITFVKGKGSYLFDENGKKYLDFGSGIAVNTLGHANKKWSKAVKKQVGTLAHTSNLYYSEPCALLAKKLAEKVGEMKVFFSNSGAEANECAIKIARKYSFDKYGEGRAKIITLVNSFHGRTVTTLSATGQDNFHTNFMPFTEGFDYAVANDFSDLSGKVDGTVCAIMLELVQGEGGVNALSNEFVEKVQNLCKEKDILLIVDEVQTGNGRTGTLYAYQGYGISPDIVSTAKGLAGGLPLGATIAFGKCEGVLTPGTHGSTFGGNPVACAGAIAVLEQLDDNLLASVRAKSEKIVSELTKLKKVKSVSGKGFMLGVETDGITATDAVAKLREKGLIVLTAKTKIRLLPPLNISDKELSEGLEIIKEVLK